MPTNQSHPGFNNQTSFDPFLGLNESEENLVAVPSEYTPSHQSYYSPTPERALKSNDGRSTRSASEAHQVPQSQEDFRNGYQTSPPLNSLVKDENWNVPDNFLTPDQLISENGYHESSDYNTTPENEALYLEQDFGMLGELNQQTIFNESIQSIVNGSDPTSAVSSGSEPHTTRAHRQSTGTATISSTQLMSPVLTDEAYTSTREVTASPPTYSTPLKIEPEFVKQGYNIHQVPEYNHPQRTPPMTDSSKNTSPDMYNPGQSIARAPSPMIRVDQYARGDSPARQAPTNSRPKRSRGGSFSSHLSVQATAGAEEEEDEEERQHSRSALDPISRGQISDEPIASLKDQDESSQRAFKNADVADWLERNTPVNEGSNLPPEKPRGVGSRRRARSTGAARLSQANLESLQTTPVDTHIPGPGLLIDESSVGEGTESEGVPSIECSPLPSPTFDINEKPGDAFPGIYDELPNQPALYRAKLWQDPLYDSSDPGVKMQPVSSNEAIERFRQRNADIETVSRVATWGTRRRSESDMASLFRRFTLTSLKEDESSTEETKKRDRSGSIFQRLVPRRNSTMRRKESDKYRQTSPQKPMYGEHSRTSSGDSRHGKRQDSLSVPGPVTNSIKRMGSIGKRPKSPRVDTSSAVAAMAKPLAAVGNSGTFNSDITSPTHPFAAAKNVIKRSRSRSDINESGSSKLADLWTQQGGPPMPTLVAPKTEEPGQMALDDEDEDEDADEPGIKMDLSVKLDPITPTLDGFRDNVKQLNPRLPSWLIDRIAQEQLRRFKKLLDFKVKHVAAVADRKCASTKHCIELGGEPTYLESKAKKESDVPQTGFSVSGIGPSDEEVNALADGIVTPAQFPAGVPLPPIKRLPAEFECSLCYKVKKFSKPSDWSKHVHEDVQPFTCTFFQCAEPKSFKRKADWVRHENERHRQLEWWQCNMNDCSHRCYRKDNFVQHLVREHKLPEPKYKTLKAGKPAVRGPSAQKVKKQIDDSSNPNEDIVWRMVDTCRFETPKNPKEEPCKFCGNVCNTWKKLTVHLAKHMEQISMPVLSVVKEKDVTPDTIISPIENSRITSQDTSMSPVESAGAQHQFPASVQGTLQGGFVQAPSGYPPDAHFHRASPHTYPPPRHQQHLASQYLQEQVADPHMMPHVTQYNNSSPDYDVVGHPGVYAPQSSHAEGVYGVQAPSSQGRMQQYQENNFQYGAPPQASFADSPTGESLYHFGAQASAGMNSQATSSMSYPQPNGSAAIYGRKIGGMGSPPAGQIYHQAQPHSQLSGQTLGYNVNQMGFAQVSSEETSGYVQPTGSQGYVYPR